MFLELKSHRVAIIGAALVALGFAGCSRRDDSQTAGQKVDSAIAKIDEKADAAKTEIKREVEQVKESAGQAVTDVKQATSGAAQTAATALQDTAITAGIKAKLAMDPDLKTLDIHVETTAGRALLRGTAPNAAAQSRATQLATAVDGVISVDNQLTVAR
jgi:hyperosmotically inducible periplasmic protein